MPHPWRRSLHGGENDRLNIVHAGALPAGRGSINWPGFVSGAPRARLRGYSLSLHKREVAMASAAVPAVTWAAALTQSPFG